MRLKELREAFGLTQAQVAERGTGYLRDYRDVLNLEKGRGKGTTDRIRAGYAKAFAVSRDMIAGFMEGKVSIGDVLAASGKRADEPELAATCLRRLDRWPELVAEARRARPLIAPEVFERLADRPFVWGSLDSVDATLVADLASSLENWEARAAHREPTPLRRGR